MWNRCSHRSAQDKLSPFWPCQHHPFQTAARKLQENCWGADTLYLQFPPPCVFHMQGHTLPNISQLHSPRPMQTPTRAWGGCRLWAELPPTSLAGASPWHIPPAKLLKSITCEVHPAPSYHMSASAATAPFPRLRVDKTVNPVLASE